MFILKEDILDIITILFYYLSGASEVGLNDAELIFCTERGGLLKAIPFFILAYKMKLSIN
jgi:hypothetical protein